MVRFNVLKNTIAASMIGITATLGGYTAKCPNAVLKNVNKLERQYATDVLEYAGKADNIKTLSPQEITEQLMKSNNKSNADLLQKIADLTKNGSPQKIIEQLMKSNNKSNADLLQKIVDLTKKS